MRYEKQIKLNVLGEKRQELIERATVAIIGAGGLGSFCSELLVRAGLKNLTIVDIDKVELTNLHRQSLYFEKDINKLKVEVAADKLKAIDSKLNIKTINLRLTDKNINIKADLIIDCTDNIETKLMLNNYSIKNKIPFISGSVAGTKGFVFVVTKNTPSLRSIFKDQTIISRNCKTDGILNTIVSTIASIQATEAIKILTKQQSTKELINYDIWKNELTRIKIS